MEHKWEEVKIVKPEFSGKRPLKYSGWHRTLSPKCYAMNIDWIEIRNWKIVAIIEEKDGRANRQIKPFTKNVMLLLANALNVPCYVAFHNLEIEENKDLWQFHLVNLKNNEEKLMNEKEYRYFLENL